jgi:hypothetical protein
LVFLGLVWINFAHCENGEEHWVKVRSLGKGGISQPLSLSREGNLIPGNDDVPRSEGDADRRKIARKEGERHRDGILSHVSELHDSILFGLASRNGGAIHVGRRGQARAGCAPVEINTSYAYTAEVEIPPLKTDHITQENRLLFRRWKP